MIIPEEKRKVPPPPSSEASTESSVSATSTQAGTGGPELPPAYTAAHVVQVHAAHVPTPTSLPIAGPSSPPPLSPRIGAGDGPPAGLKPGNFVLISRSNEAVRGTFVVDPTLAVPAAALPPIADGGVRENMLLESQNGSVKSDVHVYVAPGTAPEKKALRASIRAKSYNGSVNLRLRRDALTTAAVHLTGISKNGSVEVYLPRSFVGPFTLTTRNGSLKRSDAVTATSTLFYEANGTQRGFIGDHAATDWGADPDGWLGDALVLESANGSCRIYYVDELDSPDTPSTGKGKGFFSKLFG